MAEHRTRNAKVKGSIPLAGSMEAKELQLTIQVLRERTGKLADRL